MDVTASLALWDHRVPLVTAGLMDRLGRMAMTEPLAPLGLPGLRVMPAAMGITASLGSLASTVKRVLRDLKVRRARLVRSAMLVPPAKLALLVRLEPLESRAPSVTLALMASVVTMVCTACKEARALRGPLAPMDCPAVPARQAPQVLVARPAALGPLAGRVLLDLRARPDGAVRDRTHPVSTSLFVFL